LPAVVENPSDVVARDGMAVAQYIAGMGFSNVGLGLVHGMAHPLGAYFDIPHGVANALLLPIVMQYNAQSAIEKYSDIAKAMGVNIDGMTKEAAAQAAVDAVKALAVKVGIPEKLRDLKVTEESLEKLALSAFNDVCTPGNPREVTLEEVLELYKTAY
jgi:Alcohol dehydrogenase, class IV